MHNISDPRRTPETPRSSLQLHGVLVRVDGTGVLLLGESGTGKSECALELISDGHQLVADDVVEVRRDGDRIVGTAPPLIRNLLAIRGLGIINVREVFGETAVESESRIDLCVEICDGPARHAVENTISEESILGCRIPKLVFSSKAARNLSSFITTTVHGQRSISSVAAAGSSLAG